MIRRWGVAVAVLLASVGCTVRLGDFTVASPRNVPTEFNIKAERVSGRDCVLQILGIPVGTLNPTIDGAVDDALQKIPGADALTDVALYQDFNFFVVVTQICIRVEGKAVSTR